MMAGHPDMFSVFQPSNLSTIVFDKPTLKAMWRSAACRISAAGQGNLRIDNLAGQLRAILAGVVVVEQRNEEVFKLRTTPSRNRFADSILEDKCEPGLAKRLLKHDAVHRVIWARKPIPVRNQDVGNLKIF
jgi:hypothetical protein